VELHRTAGQRSWKAVIREERRTAPRKGTAL
jgi:hypothetical protein